MGYKYRKLFLIAKQLRIAELRRKKRKMFRGALILCVVLAFVYAENYTWGIRQHNDRLLDRSFAKRSSSFARVVTLDISYPNKTVCLYV